MTRLTLVLVPAAVVLGALLGRGRSLPVAVLWGLAVGAVAAVVLWSRHRARLHALAEHVNGWLTQWPPAPVRLEGGRAWQELGVALNAVGAAYGRRGSKLRRELPWRRDLVDSLVGPALLFSDEGRLVAANADARRLLGLAEDGGRPTFVQALGSSALAGAAREALSSQRRVTVEAVVGDRELRAVASVVGEEVLVVLTDRTQERHTEEVRRAFVVNASHELKTPAAAIQTLADALDVVLESDPARARSVVERLHAESDRLVRIVSDLLDLRRLEDAGELQTVPVDVVALVREVVADVAGDAAAGGVAVHVEAPDQAHVAGIAGDLRLVIENLVRNAIHYNQRGGEVRVVVRARDGSYELVVADTGIGIPQQDLPRVFERFYRVDEGRSRETGGTGLGLSIVKHAVDRQGGTIRVESLLGEGTTFTVRFPIAGRP
ncbi:MAG: two-component sensor histidine kinase [Actinobacteria bacterium]|nr:two-component sensor histidine kinase [Actinomycetota bacterium]